MDTLYKFFEHCWAVFLVFLAGKLFGFLDWSWWLVFSPLIAFVVIALLGFVLGYALYKKSKKTEKAKESEEQDEFVTKMAQAIQKNSNTDEVTAKMMANQFMKAMDRRMGDKS